MSRALVPLAPGGVLAGKNVRTGNLFSIAPDDLAVHMQVVGASRTGKSTFLEVIARQHILQADGVRRGLLFLDPHGTTVDSLVRWIAKHNLHRYRTVRILDPSHPEYSFGFNPFRTGTFDRAALSDLVVNATVAVWGGEDVRKTPRVRSSLWELYHALGTLGLTLCEARDFLRHEDPKGLRRYYLERLEELDEDGAAFWADLEAISATRRNEYLEGAASRLRPFLRSPFVRRIFGQTARSIDLAEAMDEGEIILVRLKHGEHLSPQAAPQKLLSSFNSPACFSPSCSLSLSEQRSPPDPILRCVGAGFGTGRGSGAPTHPGGGRGGLNRYKKFTSVASHARLIVAPRMVGIIAITSKRRRANIQNMFTNIAKHVLPHGKNYFGAFFALVIIPEVLWGPITNYTQAFFDFDNCVGGTPLLFIQSLGMFLSFLFLAFKRKKVANGGIRWLLIFLFLLLAVFVFGFWLLSLDSFCPSF